MSLSAVLLYACLRVPTLAPAILGFFMMAFLKRDVTTAIAWFLLAHQADPHWPVNLQDFP